MWHLLVFSNQIVNHTVGDELYEQVKNKLQQQILEKKYEGYKLEEDVLLTYKNIIYIQNVAYLRQQIVNHTTGDELYEQVKDKLQQKSLKNRCEGYKLEEDGLLTYKGRIYIPKVAILGELLWMRSIKLHILVTQDTRRQFLQLESNTFGQE